MKAFGSGGGREDGAGFRDGQSLVGARVPRDGPAAWVSLVDENRGIELTMLFWPDL